MTPPAAVPPPSSLRRLPGRSPSLRTRAGVRATLWLDGSQLVQESVRAYTQEIHRFGLADIQALQFRNTPRGLVYNAILLALTALPLIGLALSWDDRTSTTGDRYFLGITAGFFAVFLVINLARGQTCRTTLTTALGPQHLSSLSRVRPTRRALALIAGNIAAVQGALQPDEAAQVVDRERTRTP